MVENILNYFDKFNIVLKLSARKTFPSKCCISIQKKYRK